MRTADQDGWVRAVLAIDPPKPAGAAVPAHVQSAPTPAPAPAPPQAAAKLADPTSDQALGSISAKYESGNKGSNAVGYDSTGGWSYGKYQIATKTGTMKKFMAYVKDASPDVYKALNDAGGTKGATDHTDDFAKAWDKAAKDGTLEPLEHGFIKDTHFTQQQTKLSDAGVDLTKRDKALSDVVWSVSVQHGPGSNLVETALKKLVDAEKAKDKGAKVPRTDQQIIDGIDDKTLIDAIYDERGATVKKGDKTVLKYFSGSTEAVQESVAARFKAERKAAQAELTADQAAAKAAAAQPASAPAAGAANAGAAQK